MIEYIDGPTEKARIIPVLPKPAYKKVICAFDWKGIHYRIESDYILIDKQLSHEDMLIALRDNNVNLVSEASADGVVFKPVVTDQILVKLSDGTYAVNR